MIFTRFSRGSRCNRIFILRTGEPLRWKILSEILRLDERSLIHFAWNFTNRSLPGGYKIFRQRRIVMNINASLVLLLHYQSTEWRTRYKSYDKKIFTIHPSNILFFFTLILHINFNSHPISSRERKLEKEESFSKKGGKKGTTAIKSRPRLKTILLPSRVKPRATAGFIDFLPNSTCTAQETVSEIQATSPLLPIFSYRNRKFPVLVSHWPRAELLQIGRETKVGTGRGDKRVAQVEESGEGN